MADEILEKDGMLVSEQPFGVPPSPRNLVQRDRLQSGLSIATFVMQTDIKGGSSTPFASRFSKIACSLHPSHRDDTRPSPRARASWP